MQKKYLLVTAVLLTIFVLLYSYLYLRGSIGTFDTTTPVLEESNGQSYEEIYGKAVPTIVSHFACSDYCPGGDSRYRIDIYLGVTDAKECEFLGGSLYSYTGWGTTTVCSVNKVKIR